MAMKIIEKHNLHEQVLTQVLGWKWVSYIGVPVRGTAGYPAKCRVRSLMSPKTLKTENWIEYLKTHEGADADMTEPLEYSYCSSMGPEIPPRIMILVDER